YQFVDAAHQAHPGVTRDSGIWQAQSLSEGGYGRQNSMKDYLYVRASQPDAFGVLYLTPAMMGMLNLNDHSFTLTQETTYKPGENLEWRTQISWIGGGRLTEYGEKQNDLRLEARSRYFF